MDRPSVGAIIVGARLGENDHIKDNMKVFDINLDQDDKTLLKMNKDNL